MRQGVIIHTAEIRICEMTRLKPELLVLFIFLTSLPLFGTDWASIMKDVGPGIAKISLTDSNGALISQGTGFAVNLLNSSEKLVTNAHVVSEAQHNSSITISAQFLYGVETSDNVYSATIDKIDLSLDICTLHLDKPAPASLKLSKDIQTGIMTEILVMGYPLGRNFKATPGFVQAYQKIDGVGEMIDLSSILAPGNSGGPVINPKGEVIGISTSTIPGYNFNLALPIRNLQLLTQGETLKQLISILSEPQDARIFLDHHFKGKTPFTAEIYNKEYNLLIEKDGYIKIETTIGPWNDKDRVEMDFHLKGVENQNPLIHIITKPEGASISINNQYMGETPVSVRMPEGRLLRMEIAKKRYKTYSETYLVAEEREQTVTIELEK